MLRNSKNQDVMEWGKSMYGGYYANYFDNNTGRHDGEHADKLVELCNKIGLSATALRRDVRRIDN
jgi:hypothetical protein